jgi:hypothetical protein
MGDERITARNVDGHADVLCRRRHLRAARKADGGTHLQRDRLREQFCALEDQGVDAIQKQGPALGRTHGPSRECAPRRSHGRSDISCTAQRDLRDRLLRRGVDDGAAGSRFGHDPLAANEHAIQAASAPEVLDDGGVHGVGPLETASGLLIGIRKSVAMDACNAVGCVMMGRRSGLWMSKKFRPRAPSPMLQ